MNGLKILRHKRNCLMKIITFRDIDPELREKHLETIKSLNILIAEWRRIDLSLVRLGERVE